MDTEKAKQFWESVLGGGRSELNITLDGNDIDRKLKEEMKFNTTKPRFSF